MAGSDYISAIIGGAAGLMDTGLGFLGQNINYQHNKQLQWEGHNQALIRQREAQQASIEQWERETEYNSYPEQMRRLNEAGLNSALIYGGNSVGDSSAHATMPGPAGASSAGVSPSNVRFNPSVATAFSDVLLKDSQRDLNDSKTQTEETVQSLNTVTTLLTEAKTGNERTQGAILSLQQNLLQDTYQFKVDETEKSLDLLQEQVDEARKRNQVLPEMLDAELLKLRVDAFCKLVQTHSQVQLSDAQMQALRWAARVSANSYWSSLPEAMIGRSAGDYLSKNPDMLESSGKSAAKGKESYFDVSQWLPWATFALSFVPGIGGLLGKATSILFGSINKSKDRAAKLALLRAKLGGTPKSKVVEFFDAHGEIYGGKKEFYK